MALFKPQLDFNKPKLGEEFYRAVVVDNNDPEKLHRLKIRIQELHGTEQDIPDSNLPWAIQFRPTFLGGDTNLSLTAIPRVGSDLVVTHIRGDIYQPAYIFELAHNTNRIEKGEEDYPDSYVLQDSKDNFWHVNLVQDKLDIKFNGDECLEITADRDTVIGQDDTETINGDKTKSVIGNEENTINGNRNTTIEGNETKTINSNQVNIIDSDRTENIGNNLIQTVGQTKTVNSTTLNINTSANVNITAGGNIVGIATDISWNNGSPVVTTNDLDPFTGLPHPEGSPSVRAE